MQFFKFQYVLFLFVAATFLFTSCKKGEGQISTRTYMMGFQNSAPRQDFNLVIESLKMWSQRADAAMITTEVPWNTLLSGKKVQSYIINNYKGLVDYYRTQNFKLWVYIDPANG